MEPYIKVSPSAEGARGFRYQSGRQVWDEALIGGRLVRRYIDCNGQILPEMQMPPAMYEADAREYGGAQCFALGVNGTPLEDGWSFEGMDEIADESTLYNEGRVFALSLWHDKAKMRCRVCTRLDGGDFLVRWLELENGSDRPVAITAVSPLAGRAWTHNFRAYERRETLENGCAYAVAYAHDDAWGREGDFYFDALDGNEFTYKNGHGKSGWSRPAFWLRDRMNGQTIVCEFAWQGNWQIRLTHQMGGVERATFDMGMLPLDGEALRVLQPGEKCVSPMIHFGLFQDDDDVIVQRTHEHVRRCVLPPLPEGVPVTELEANHRGYLCDRENERELFLDEDAAAEVGTELYVIDAGWYGRTESNKWWLNVGDWVSGPWLPNGLEAISAHAHEKGMRFGLWIEIEAFGADCKAREEHPDFIMTRHGIPCAGGRAIDLSQPQVEAFCLNTIADAVERYSLDMYRIDHNHNIGLGGTRVVGEYVENTLWRYYEAFNRVFLTLRKRFPRLVLQNCAGGGGRLDWGTMHMFHNTELSDWLRMPRAGRILNGVSMSLPPEVLLRCYGTESGEIHQDGDIDAQLRGVAVCRAILRGIAPTAADLTPYLREKLERFTALYKGFARDVLKDCLLYHHTPFQPVGTACAHTVLEYASPDHSRGMLIAFTQSDPGCTRALVYPRGLDMARKYKVTYDADGQRVYGDGFTLMRDGLPVRAMHCMGCELLLFEAVGNVPCP